MASKVPVMLLVLAALVVAASATAGKPGPGTKPIMLTRYDEPTALSNSASGRVIITGAQEGGRHLLTTPAGSTANVYAQPRTNLLTSTFSTSAVFPSQSERAGRRLLAGKDMQIFYKEGASVPAGAQNNLQLAVLAKALNNKDRKLMAGASLRYTNQANGNTGATFSGVLFADNTESVLSRLNPTRP